MYGIQVVDEETDYIPYKTYIRPYLRETRVIKNRDYSSESRDQRSISTTVHQVIRAHDNNFDYGFGKGSLY